MTAAPLESFATWIAGTGVSDVEQGSNDDPDGDGITNLLEYALGLNPALADAGAGPRIEIAGGIRRLVFQRSKTAAVDPVVIEIGASLDDFSLHSPVAQDLEITDQGETELVSVALPEPGGQVFARLRTSAQ